MVCSAYYKDMATPLTSSTSALNVSSSAADIIIERVGNGVVAFSSLFIPLQTATQSLGPTTATPTQNAPSDTDVSNSSKLNGGAIAAILFAIIATIATIATGAWIHWKRKKRMQSLDISDDHRFVTPVLILSLIQKKLTSRYLIVRTWQMKKES